MPASMKAILKFDRREARELHHDAWMGNSVIIAVRRHMDNQLTKLRVEMLQDEQSSIRKQCMEELFECLCEEGAQHLFDEQYVAFYKKRKFK